MDAKEFKSYIDGYQAAAKVIDKVAERLKREQANGKENLAAICFVQICQIELMQGLANIATQNIDLVK